MPNDIPIIVGGFFRSGTTLMRRILDSHSRIHCEPEIKFFRDYFGDFAEDPFAHVRFFSTARAFRVSEEHLLMKFGRAFIELHQLAAEQNGKERWADKNPENVLYLDAWELLLPAGFAFVHVVRNPFDALASLVEARFDRTVPASFEGKVELYRQYRSAGAAYCAAHPESSIEISYEDLVRLPELTVDRLLNFLGEKFEPAMLSQLNAISRGAGIEDPKASKSAFIHQKSLGRGQRELDSDARAAIVTSLSEYLA